MLRSSRCAKLQSPGDSCWCWYSESPTGQVPGQMGKGSSGHRVVSLSRVYPPSHVRWESMPGTLLVPGSGLQTTVSLGFAGLGPTSSRSRSFTSGSPAMMVGSGSDQAKVT